MMKEQSKTDFSFKLCNDYLAVFPFLKQLFSKYGHEMVFANSWSCEKQYLFVFITSFKLRGNIGQVTRSFVCIPDNN